MWHDSVCNMVQEPTVTATIVAKKTTTWGESGFPSEFLEDRGHGVHFSNLACKVPSSLDSVHGFRLSTVPKTVSITLGLVRVTPVTSRSRPQAVPHRLFVDPQETRDSSALTLRRPSCASQLETIQDAEGRNVEGY